jgi:acetyl-CoA carboxylase beta subunit
MTDKPSRNEDEYFAKESAQLLKRRQAEAAERKEVAARKAHYMKCPKCGADLFTEEYHGIQIDRCSDCAGMWLDAGEAEDLLMREDVGVINILKSIVKGVGS